MTIKQKLILSTVIIISTSLIIGLVVLYGYKHISREASISHDFDKEVMFLHMMLHGLNEVLVNEGTPVSIQTTKEGLYGFEKTHIRLLKKIKDPEMLSVLHNKVQPTLHEIKQEIIPFLNHYLELEEDESLRRAGRLITISENLIKEIEVFAEKTHAIVDENSAQSGIVKRVIIFVMGIVLLSFVYLSYHVYRSIAHPIEKLKNATKEIGKGELNTKIEIDSNDEIGQLAVSFNNMTADLKKANDEKENLTAKLQILSLTDELTGLYNRRGFFNLSEQQLKLAKRTKEKVYMLYLDIDRFKEINDTFGHKEGDEVLKHIAMILKDCYRESDVIGRVGGDEFVVFPIGTNYETIKIVVDRLLERIDIHNRKSNKSYKLSVSIGVANYDPKNPCSLDELLNQADKLMYNQKKKNKKSLSLLSPTKQ